MVDTQSKVVAFYRTNGKKVQVRTQSKYRDEASCYITDKFDLFFGIQLAYLRCKNKFLKNMKEGYQKGIKQINSELRDNEKLIKQMIKSLSNKEEESDDIITEKSTTQ